jgi:hypothetical protein
MYYMHQYEFYASSWKLTKVMCFMWLDGFSSLLKRPVIDSKILRR